MNARERERVLMEAAERYIRGEIRLEEHNAIRDAELASRRRSSRVTVHLPGLKRCRERALLTQAELAERSGVAEVTINRLERGRHEARFSTVRKLAAALGVEPDELVAQGQEGKAAARTDLAAYAQPALAGAGNGYPRPW